MDCTGKRLLFTLALVDVSFFQYMASHQDSCEKRDKSQSFFLEHAPRPELFGK